MMQKWNKRLHYLMLYFLPLPLPSLGVGGIYVPSAGGAVAAAHADGAVFGVGIGGTEREPRSLCVSGGGSLHGLHWIRGEGVWGQRGVMIWP